MKTSIKNKQRILKAVNHWQNVCNWNFVKAAKVAITHFKNEDNWLVRNLVEEAGFNYSNGICHYSGQYEISQSGQSLKVQHEDKFVYVPISRTVTDGKIYWIPFSAIENGAEWTERNLGTIYVGG